MRYELIITRTQPPCGGKPPKLHTSDTVETDDPIGYVYVREKDLPTAIPLEVTHNGLDTLIISFDRGAQHVTYEFSKE